MKYRIWISCWKYNTYIRYILIYLWRNLYNICNFYNILEEICSTIYFKHSWKVGIVYSRGGKNAENRIEECCRVKAASYFRAYARIFSLAFARVSTRNEDETGTGKQDSCRVIDPLDLHRGWLRSTYGGQRTTTALKITITPNSSLLFFHYFSPKVNLGYYLTLWH